jgi:hypothetical protein
MGSAAWVSEVDPDPDPDSDPDFEKDEYQQAEALDALFRASDSWCEKDRRQDPRKYVIHWIPAFAGMTEGMRMRGLNIRTRCERRIRFKEKPGPDHLPGPLRRRSSS